MSKFLQLLKKRMEDRGFSPNDQQLAQFGIYWQELRDWNTRVNLTSITDDMDIINKHFIDSLLLLRHMSLQQPIKVADVGTGAGFPGLPLKIYQSDIHLLLLESIGKKTKFLEHIVSRLDLAGVKILTDRAELVAQTEEHREQYDLVVSRSVAALPILAEYCIPLVSIGGKFVAYKGLKAEVEAEEAMTALEILGGRFDRVEWNMAPGLDGRAFVFIEKVQKTSDKYPRRPGMPRKRPL